MNKTWKVSLATLATFATAWAASPASPVAHAAQTKKPTIGFTVYSMTSWVSWGQQGVNTEAKALGANVEWMSANGDVNTQLSQMQTFINQHVSAIVVAAVNSATLAPQIQAATKAGIPVFAVNMQLNAPASNYIKAYVGPNDVGAGQQEMENMAKALHGKGNIAVLQGPIGQSAETDRTKGIQNILKKYPNIHVLSMQPGNWDRTTAYNLAQDWLSQHGSKLNGIVAENDDMAIGALQALGTKKLIGKVPVVGIDGIQDGMREVRKGAELESNLQDAALEMGEALAVADSYLNHKPFPKMALINMPEITKSNVQHYYKQLYVHPTQFLQALPVLIKKDLASGNYSHQ